MGSKSKSKKNNSVSTNATQMANLQRQNPAATLSQMLMGQQGMQNTQLENVMGAFNQMKNAGDEQMAQNPMQALLQEVAGSLLGPGAMSDADMYAMNDMFDMSQFEPEQPQQPQAAQVAPPGYGGQLPQGYQPSIMGGFGSTPPYVPPTPRGGRR